MERSKHVFAPVEKGMVRILYNRKGMTLGIEVFEDETDLKQALIDLKKEEKYDENKAR